MDLEDENYDDQDEEMENIPTTSQLLSLGHVDAAWNGPKMVSVVSKENAPKIAQEGPKKASK